MRQSWCTFKTKSTTILKEFETRATVFLKRTNFTSQINSEIYWPLEGSESWGEIGIKILERNCSIWIVFVSILFYQLLKVKTQRMCTINGSSNRPSRKVTNFKKLNWSWTYFEQKTSVTFAVSNLQKIYNYLWNQHEKMDWKQMMIRFQKLLFDRERERKMLKVMIRRLYCWSEFFVQKIKRNFNRLSIALLWHVKQIVIVIDTTELSLQS